MSRIEQRISRLELLSRTIRIGTLGVPASIEQIKFHAVASFDLEHRLEVVREVSVKVAAAQLEMMDGHTLNPTALG